MSSEHKGVEDRLADWESQSPACVTTDSERTFIDDMRRAAARGVGYGWMQQVIEWEWQHVSGGHGWGPEYHTKQIAAFDALVDALQEIIDWFEKARTMQHEHMRGLSFLEASKAWETMPEPEPLNMTRAVAALAIARRNTDE